MKKYRFISALLCSAIIISTMPAVNADDNIYAALTYTTVDEDEDGNADSITITGCDDTAVSITIPEVIDNLPVTAIETHAFYNKDLESVTIGNNIKVIGEYAFFRNDMLTKLNLGNSVEYIQDQAFAECSALTEINLPDSLIIIGKQGFSGCSNITKVNIPSGIISMGQSVFKYCNKLTSITVDEANEYYSSHDGVLYDEYKKTLLTYPCNKSNTEYILPDSVTTIAESAFYNAENIEKILLGQSVGKIERDAFASCKNLMSITVMKVNCSVYPDQYTFYTGMDGDGYYFNGTIYGYENSTIQEYAEKFNKNFVSLGSYSDAGLLYGDANNDGMVNVRDCAFIANLLASGQSSLLIEQADYTHDSKADVRDAAAIARDLSLKIL